MRLVSWNIARQPEAWNYLARDDSIDAALLQEANEPTALDQMDVVSGRPFRLAGWKKRAFSTAVVDCSQRYNVRATPAWNSIERASADELGVSRPGSLALAFAKCCIGYGTPCVSPSAKTPKRWFAVAVINSRTLARCCSSGKSSSNTACVPRRQLKSAVDG